LNKLPGTERNLEFGVFQRQDRVKVYVVCYHSPWQDYMAYDIKKALEDFNLAGVYLDATAWPFPCRNYLHGCGYRTGNGWVATTPTFALVKRPAAVIYGAAGGGLLRAPRRVPLQRERASEQGSFSLESGSCAKAHHEALKCSANC